MFYTITNVQSEEPCRLLKPIDNPDGCLEVGLRSVTYTTGWFNIECDQSIDFRENGGIIKTLRVTPGLYGFAQLKELIDGIL